MIGSLSTWIVVIRVFSDFLRWMMDWTSDIFSMGESAEESVCEEDDRPPPLEGTRTKLVGGRGEFEEFCNAMDYWEAYGRYMRHLALIGDTGDGHGVSIYLEISLQTGKGYLSDIPDSMPDKAVWELVELLKKNASLEDIKAYIKPYKYHNWYRQGVYEEPLQASRKKENTS